MRTEKEKQDAHERHLRAVKCAKKILKPGDKLRVERCCHLRKSTITFAAWCGGWIVSKSGIDDYSPTCVDRLNGKPVDWGKLNP